MNKNKQNKATASVLCLNEKIATQFAKENSILGTLLRLILVVAASLSSIYSFISISKTHVNILAMTVLALVFTLSFCSYKFKNRIFKIISAAVTAVSVLYFIKNIGKIIRGFKFLVNDYLTVLDAKLAFPDMSGRGYGDCVGISAALVLFLLCLGLSFTLFYRSSFVGTFFLTFPLLELGLFWGLVPNKLAFIMILFAWFVSMCMQNNANLKIKMTDSAHFSKSKNKNSFYITSKSLAYENCSSIFTFSSVIFLIITVIALILSSLFGNRPDNIREARHSLKSSFEHFEFAEIPEYTESFISSLLNFGSFDIGATHDGSLGQKGEIEFDNSVALKVSGKNISFFDSLYLKGFTASDYTGNSWEQLDEDTYGDIDLLSLNPTGFQDINMFITKRTNEITSQNGIGSLDEHSLNITVEKVNADHNKMYLPYYTFFEKIENGGAYYDLYYKTNDHKYNLDILNYTDVRNNGALVNVHMPPLYVSDHKYDGYMEFVKENYCDVDEEVVARAYNDILKTLCQNSYFYIPSYNDGYDCRKDGFIDFEFDCTYENASIIANAISDYFSIHYEYSLKPGVTPKDEDFVKYFLEEQKKGYCTYFASAGTLLMRAFGFPARYAEGFVMTDDDKTTIDDDGITTVKITDRSSHAWCEVFLKDMGWTCAEFTPGYNNGHNPNYRQEITTTQKPQTGTTTTTIKTGTPKPTQKEPTSKPGSFISGKTTTVNAASKTNRLNKGDNDNAFDYQKIIGIAIKAVITTVFVLIIIFSYKKLYNYKRAKVTENISLTDRSKAVIWIYKYISKLLESVGIPSSSVKTDLQYCSDIFNKLSEYGVAFSDESFYDFTELAVEADMSKNIINESSYEFAKSIYDDIFAKIYAKQKPLKKLSLKYFKFLY